MSNNACSGSVSPCSHHQLTAVAVAPADCRERSALVPQSVVGCGVVQTRFSRVSRGGNEARVLATNGNAHGAVSTRVNTYLFIPKLGKRRAQCVFTWFEIAIVSMGP